MDAGRAGWTVMVTGISPRVPRVIHRAARRSAIGAVDASGSGKGATIGTVAPIEVPSVTLTVPASPVPAGTEVTLSGRVTGTGGRALAGVHVLLRYQPAAAGCWTGVPLTTSADGAWSFRLPVRRTTVLVATVSGVPGVRAGATSAEVTVTVA